MKNSKNRSKFFLATYASTTSVLINLVGQLMLAEVLALFTIPFINLKVLLKKHRDLKIILGGLTILLLAQIISDLINNTAPHNYLRGWAVIIFAMISTIFLVNYLAKDPKAIIYYLLSLFVVNLIFGQGKLDINMWYENTNYFKIRFVEFLNPAFMLLGYYFYSRKKPKITLLLFFIYGLVCMALDARSNGLIYLVSSILLYIKIKNIRFTKKKIITTALISLVLLYLGYVFYVYQVLHYGFGGANAQFDLSRASNPYNPFELLFYGRLDIIVAIKAILNAPIIGHGSWPQDVTGQYYLYTAQLLGVNHLTYRGFIPSHSILFGAWLNAGFLGFVAVSGILIVLLKEFVYIYRYNFTHLLPIITVIVVGSCWNFFFSPLGLLRTTFPLTAAFTIVLFNLSLTQRKLNNDKKIS